jgi:hypothetical protein
VEYALALADGGRQPSSGGDLDQEVCGGRAASVPGRAGDALQRSPDDHPAGVARASRGKPHRVPAGQRCVRPRADRPPGWSAATHRVPFEQEAVKIDFSGYTAETLHNAIQEPLDKIREGRLTPRAIQLRLLLLDMSVPMAIPSRAGDEPGDDPRVRARMARTAQRYAGGIAESVSELADLQLVQPPA